MDADTMDWCTAAPPVLVGPTAATNTWGLEDLSIYVLGFYLNVIHCPADFTRQARFRMRGVTIRADAFHCQNGMRSSTAATRAPPWFLPCDGSCGTQGGYMNAVVRLGFLENVTNPSSPAE